jgi:tellurium resistance protein TerD
MAVNLVKGGRVNISKDNAGLEKILVGLGWDPNITDTGDDFDLDASLFVLDKSGKVISDDWFIFYNQLRSPDGSIVHQGDNRTGEGEGDDEKIEIYLSKIDNRVDRIVFVVTIHEADERRQNFGQVNNSYIRIVDTKNNKEILKYELDEDYSTETAINFGELYKKNGEWRFKAVGDGFKGGLREFAKMYGVNV